MESRQFISWTYCGCVKYRSDVATVTTRREPADPPRSGRRGPAARVTSPRPLYRSTIGKKIVMAVTGLLMLAFVVVHMLGNLKIFFGAEEFVSYAHWLRTIGEPALHEAWFLWVQRTVLTVALVAHIWAAASLTRQDRRAR